MIPNSLPFVFTIDTTLIFQIKKNFCFISNKLLFTRMYPVRYDNNAVYIIRNVNLTTSLNPYHAQDDIANI